MFRAALIAVALGAAVTAHAADVPPATRGAGVAFEDGSRSRGVGVAIRTKSSWQRDLYSRSFALVIGASSYSHWDSLPGVREDIDSVTRTLRRHDFDVTVVRDPKSSDFDAVVRNFITEHGGDRKARLLIYYAGHGHSIETADGRANSYLVPVDAPNPQLDEESTKQFRRLALNMARVLEYAKEIDSHHVLFVFDSCFSGGVFEATRGYPSTDMKNIALPVREFLSAGKAGERVLDVSVFRREFENGINGAADTDSNGYVTGTELWRHLRKTVPAATGFRQTPQFEKIARRDLSQGEFLFFVPGASDRTTAVAPPPEPAQVAGSRLEPVEGRISSISVADGLLTIETAQRRTVRLAVLPGSLVRGVGGRNRLDQLNIGDQIRVTDYREGTDGELRISSLEVVALAPPIDPD